MARPALAATGLLVVVALAGCSNATFDAGPGTSPTPTLSQPDEAAFHPGGCRTAAPSVLQVGRDALLLGDGPTPDAEVQGRLAQAQDDIDAAAAALEPQERSAVQALVVSIGLVRLRADGNTYTPDLGTQLSSAYEDAVRACTS